MAAIFPTWQKWFELPNGTVMGVHRVKLVTGRIHGGASDTFATRLPASHTTATLSVAQVRDDQDPAVTVTQAAATGIVTVVGNKNDEATIVTYHKSGAGSSFGRETVTGT